MGKAEDDEFSFSYPYPFGDVGDHHANGVNSGGGGGGSESEYGGYSGRRRDSGVWCGFVRIKCLLVLFLSVSVFLSALFWLPPFFKPQDLTDLDLDPRYRGHTIVARFTLQKPVSVLQDNVSQLETDVYYELEAASAKVTVLSLESTHGTNGSNETTVVFGVDPVSKHSSISPAELSLIRASFESLVVRHTDLHLTTSLFGQPEFFELLKFPGGITVAPVENVYPLQNVQILFNFTLNFSIRQIEVYFEDLENQLKSGLHLAQHENVYIRLTNFRGSTVTPPATVQTSVLLAVGVPSVPRLKQLAQTIKDSPARNLGLNNTVFGKVKQISLSSILQHSLGEASGPAPSPSPLHHPHRHHHHHHHHHDHHHHQSHHVPPAAAPPYSPVEAPVRPVKGAPAPRSSAQPPVSSHHRGHVAAPAPVRSYRAHFPATPPPMKGYWADPPDCRFKSKNRHIGRSPAPSPSGVAVRPTVSPHRSAPPPHQRANPTTPVVHHISPSSRLPNVIYARVPPPSVSVLDPEPPDKMPAFAPSTSFGGRLYVSYWLHPLLVALVVLHHW